MLTDRDAWALGSYRRDALVVPAFDRDAWMATIHAPVRTARTADLVPLATRLPRTLLPFEDFLRGRAAARVDRTFACELSLLLRYLASPLRYDPRSPEPVRKAVPSAGSLFPCRIVVIVREEGRGERARAYLYHPNHHGLEVAAPSAALRRLLGDGDVAVVGIGQYWMIADKYGDYTPYLVCLEAGMLKAQLEHLVRLLGWSLQATEVDAKGWDAALGTAPLEASLFGIIATVPEGRTALGGARPRGLTAAGAHHELAQRYEHLTPLTALFGTEDCPAERLPERRESVPAPHVPAHPASPVATLDVLEVMRRRTSGNDSGGFAPAGRWPDGALLERLLTAWRALAAQRPLAPGAENLTSYIAWFGPSSPPVGLYTMQLVRQPLPLDDATFVQTLQRALPPAFRYNIPAFTMSVLLMAAVPAARATHGAHALRRVHLAAGAAVQDFCLVAAAEGLFARPIRMFREIEIETAWRLPGQLVYQVLVGFNRRSHVGVEIL